MVLGATLRPLRVEFWAIVIKLCAPRSKLGALGCKLVILQLLETSCSPVGGFKNQVLGSGSQFRGSGSPAEGPGTRKKMALR